VLRRRYRRRLGRHDRLRRAGYPSGDHFFLSGPAPSGRGPVPGGGKRMSGQGMKRRELLAGTAATLAMPALAPHQPEKLVYGGDNGPWHYVLVEEVAPAFEKETGIKIDYTLLPVDPWRARLKTELNSGSSGIDIVQWSVAMAGWLSPHFDDHQEFTA